MGMGLWEEQLKEVRNAAILSGKNVFFCATLLLFSKKNVSCGQDFCTLNFVGRQAGFFFMMGESNKNVLIKDDENVCQLKNRGVKRIRSHK